MNKSLKWIIIVIVVLLFGYSIFLALGQKKAPVTNPVDTLAVPTQSGNVNVNNFIQHPARVAGDTTVIDETDNFSIVYFTKDQSFLITILAEPIQQNRDTAEQDLLTKLNISQTDACRLNVSLTVPAAVNESAAGQNYSLSFCPNGKPF